MLTFDQVVYAGSGTIALHSADGTMVETFTVASGTGSLGGSVEISSNMITIDPAGSLAYATGYYLTIAATALTDAVGNIYAGTSAATSLTFTTQPGPSVAASEGPDQTTVETIAAAPGDGPVVLSDSGGTVL